MKHARDAHGMVAWRDRYLIVVGSWHVESSTRTCELYDIERDEWTELPSLNEGTCAPGLVIVGGRYLYKLGGTTDIGKVEMLDLEKLNLTQDSRFESRNRWRYRDTLQKSWTQQAIEANSSSCRRKKAAAMLASATDSEDQIMEDQESSDTYSASNIAAASSVNENLWITITTCNKMGRKATINRCLLYPLYPEPLPCDQFLVLGCHFGRSEAPFCYDTSMNKYVKFQKQELFVDMYRSNDVVQFDQNFIYIRPFVKVGEPSESVKVFKFYLHET